MLKVLPAPALVMKKSSLYGSFNSRLVAMLIDNFLLIFSYSIIFQFSANDTQYLPSWKMEALQLNFSPENLWLTFEAMFLNVYFLVAHWLYYTLLEASPKQATVGKFALGLKVADLRGKHINFVQANFRYLLKYFSLSVMMLGFVLIFFTRRRQMLHDLLARTVIVSRH